MKIKLIRTGGFIPITKVAETEVDFTDQELIRLIEVIKPDPLAPRIKDGNNYQLSAGTKNTLVDLEKVPDEYRELFNKLKSELKIIK
ncbi:MAG TPA: hypothetical protein VFE71_01225 [Bacteroidales bacterium]|nr:hypothetical protein [Bacteroidales bacterium]